MFLALHPLPLAEPILPGLARWLLANRAGLEPHDLADMLVLLPSQRACDQVAHALLECSGAPSLVLPRLVTPARLTSQLVDLVGPDDEGALLPDPALRPLVFAPHLARLDWLRERPEAADGLAVELVDLFDELRRAGYDHQVLAASDPKALFALVDAATADVLASDLERIRAAWRCYREVLPIDQVDRQIAALAMAREAWPGQRPTLVAAAHLGRLDQVVVDLLRALPAQGVPVHWLTAEADDQRSRLLLATYRDHESPAHPLRAIRRLITRLGLEPPPLPAFAGHDLAARLAALDVARGQLEPGGKLALRACRDPEHESRVVAEVVCQELAAAADGGLRAPTILVATADRDLAARITAQLGDAGVNVDDTRGRPLVTLPAGRLLRDLLRTVAGGWAFAPLFEVLAHPYVRLVGPGARPGHAVRVQVLEAAVRRARTARRGLETLRAIAAQDDRSPANAGRDWSLAALVDDLAAALAPLANLADRDASWLEATAALRATWALLVPERPLDAEPDTRLELDDVGAVADLLESLTEAAPWLEPVRLGALSAAIGDLLRGPVCEVRPHRQRHLPVRVVGLVEARLETADLLVLAGLSQDVFPGRLARPLLLPDALRERLGLVTWRARADQAAELFLRVLHAAPRVVMTWPREREGRDALPSPMVQRLLLAAGREPDQAGEPVLRRRAVLDTAALATAEVRHRAEPEPIPAPDVRPPRELSHSALQQHRECPYRFLLASSLGLRRPDPLEADFGPADVGNLAHAAMRCWLAPDGAGWAALARGDRTAALAALHDAAQAAADASGNALPGGMVAVQGLLALGPALVEHELGRAATWRPAAVEAPFTFTLGAALDWLGDLEPDTPPAAVPDAWREVVLKGTIDRIDRRRDESLVAAVLDYKTGTIPSRKNVRDGRQLQVHLYALAVELGGVGALPDGAWRVHHGGYYGLARRTLGVPGEPHLASRDDLIEGVRAIIGEVLQMLDPQAPYALVPQWKNAEAQGQLPCRVCEFLGVCRLEERDTSPPLAARLAALLVATPRRTA